MLAIYEIIPPVIPSAGLYFFTTDSDVRYEVRFGRKQHDLLSASIVFGVINDEYDGEEYTITNKGEIYRVLNTIVEIVKMYRDQHPNVSSYEFTGEPTDEERSQEKDNSTKRIRVYTRYVRRIFGDDWNVELIGNKIIASK